MEDAKPDQHGVIGACSQFVLWISDDRESSTKVKGDVAAFASLLTLREQRSLGAFLVPLPF